jgi:cytochrome c551/c552
MQFTLKPLCLILAGSLFFTSLVVAGKIKDSAESNEQALKDSLACPACSQEDTKMMEPSLNAIALSYKDKNDAAAVLEKKILAGGTGVWKGTMPPNAAKNQAADMVKWILSLKPEVDDKAEAEIANMSK